MLRCCAHINTHCMKITTATLRLNFQPMRFAFVGLSAFFIDFGILNFLVYVCDFRVMLFGNILVANVISTVTAVVYAFILQKRWTFQITDSHRRKRQFVSFVALQGFNLVVYNTLVFNFLVNNSHAPIPVSKIIVAAVQMVSSYLCMRFLIFHKSSPEGV